MLDLLGVAGGGTLGQNSTEQGRPLRVIKMLLRIKIKRLYPSGEYRSCLADISWGILLMSGAQG